MGLLLEAPTNQLSGSVPSLCSGGSSPHQGKVGLVHAVVEYAWVLEAAPPNVGLP